MRTLEMNEVQDVSGGFIMAALLLADVAIWAYDGYMLGQIVASSK